VLGTLSGRVEVTGGFQGGVHPVGSATITHTNGSGASCGTTTDATGRYTLSVPPGLYVLKARCWCARSNFHRRQSAAVTAGRRAIVTIHFPVA
jgi:hypothetical protein